jgi:hypothetical protein
MVRLSFHPMMMCSTLFDYSSSRGFYALSLLMGFVSSTGIYILRMGAILHSSSGLCCRGPIMSRRVGLCTFGYYLASIPTLSMEYSI